MWNITGMLGIHPIKYKYNCCLLQMSRRNHKFLNGLSTNIKTKIEVRMFSFHSHMLTVAVNQLCLRMSLLLRSFLITRSTQFSCEYMSTEPKKAYLINQEWTACTFTLWTVYLMFVVSILVCTFYLVELVTPNNLVYCIFQKHVFILGVTRKWCVCHSKFTGNCLFNLKLNLKMNDHWPWAC